MDDVTIARAVHIVFVVLWIGGVGFVTTVLLPAIRGLKASDERMAFFHAVERRFAWQARISTAWWASRARTCSLAWICGSGASTAPIGGCTRWSQCGCYSR